MVHAVETNLQKLLEGTKQYQVPLYQRTYSWKTEQLTRLWEDLVKLAEDRHQHGAPATHFIGSLVLAPSPNIGPAGLQEFLVVDGQQRLTTLTVLLTAIRDHRAETEDSSHFDRVNEKYLINKWEDGQPTKLLPTQADRGPYLACVRRTPQAGGADPVGSAYRFFKARVADLDDPDDDLDIQRLEEAVIAGLSLVCVTAGPGDNVHRIFESLNNTGARLTQADLIRNYLFMRLPTRAEHVYQSLWLPLQQALTGQQLELLFWLDLVQADETAKQTDTYSLQQAKLDRISTEEGVENEVKRFARLGKLLAVILDPTHELDAVVRQGLERLNAWGTTTAYPLLLHLLDRRAEGDATSDEIATAMRYLESFFVRRVVIGRATAGLNRNLLRAVQEVRSRAPVDDALRDYLSAGRKFFASDAEIRAAVSTVPFYWSGKAAQKNLILRWLEDSYGSKEPVTGLLTIEHVMPQSAPAEWLELVGDELAPGEDVDAIYQGLVHTIGNLTLTGYNSELSNSRFDVKRPLLTLSALRMNQEIGKCDSWGRKEILARAAGLAERIVAIWPGPNATTANSVESTVWSTLNQVLAAMPAGAWTTYGDVAAVVGTHPVPLGQRLANHPVPNAHRVLSASGVVAGNFRWIDPNRTDSARDVLTQEGVHFDAAGRADAAQRLSAEDLATLSGLDTQADIPGTDPDGLDEQRSGFYKQLAVVHAEDVIDATQTVLSAWIHLGGWISFGSSDETSCFLLTSQLDRGPWPFTIYPSGKVEVVFQHMANRPPFDDVELRQEFRSRLNEVEGIDLPESKIALRPGFPVDVLSNADARDGVIRALAWFIHKVQEHPAVGDDA